MARRRLGNRAIPERTRVTWSGAPAGSTPLPLPSPRTRLAGIVIGVFFVIMASIAWGTFRSIGGDEIETVFDLTTFLFQSFWLLGWSLGVVILGLLTTLFLLYGESARLYGDRLLFISGLGPVRFWMEYDLRKIDNLRMEKARGGQGEMAEVRFDYGDRITVLGNAMPLPAAERLVAAIERAMTRPLQPPDRRGEPFGFDLPRAEPLRSQSDVAGTPSNPALEPAILSGPWWKSPSNLALIGANLVPVAGVIFLDWNLGQIMVLFWAESAVIAFYNLLKVAVVSKWAVLFTGPFFLAHFGAFMSIHFLFIYEMFVRGVAAEPDEPVVAALQALFRPMWFALAALVISHGVSFFRNFVLKREYAGMTTEKLMTDPYRRVILMQVTLIFGGWLLFLLKTPVPALALLLALKSMVDLHAHRKEHARVSNSGQFQAAAPPSP